MATRAKPEAAVPVSVLRAAGIPEGDIQNMVTATEPTLNGAKHRDKNLATLEEATNATPGAKFNTLRTWLRSGHLQERGRCAAPGPRRSKPLVDINDVRRLVENPPPRGRPKEN